MNWVVATTTTSYPVNTTPTVPPAIAEVQPFLLIAVILVVFLSSALCFLPFEVVFFSRTCPVCPVLSSGFS